MNSSLKNNPIGFFDSGVGGLSVYSKFQTLLPNENLIYFGDLKNLPYGNKTQDELVNFARNILKFFTTKSVKAVVIACNTSSALAYEQIKNDYDFKIYPIIQSCAKVIATTEYSKIGVFATEGTVQSKAYSKEIRKYNSQIDIREIACPNWVSIVEGRLVDDNDLKKHLEEMMWFNPEKIVLGCTHYPYLLNKLSRYIDKSIFIDPSEIFVDYIRKDLQNLNLLNESKLSGSEEFYVSSNPEAFAKNSQLFKKINLECIKEIDI